MKINLENKSPLLFAIFGRNKTGDIAINGLKSYMEDPKEFYGFNIEMGTIRDSVIASTVLKIRNKDVFLKIQDAYLDLLNYIKANNLSKAGHISISYIPISYDSLQITVGIPVNKTAPPDKEINCLLLPAKGKVLLGNYEGRFSDRKKIYLSMSKYLTDHSLSIPAESFERYLNDSIPSSDSSMIRIELNYPVY
jgi:effector-binding domain-containing protein